jgi:predicted O-methyltransferase YrrM
MSGITDKQVEKYLHSLLPKRDALLREMEEYAAQHNVPIMGPACARVLYQLARLIHARRVFEMGSAIGYSTLWLARAVGPGGTVYYTDNDPENARRAEASFRRAGVAKRVRILVGDALESLRSTKGRFDLIFNDVHMDAYPEVFRVALPRVRTGGLFVTDDVLLDHHVARPGPHAAPWTGPVREFNRLIYRSPRLFTTILPLWDGLAVCLKLKRGCERMA